MKMKRFISIAFSVALLVALLCSPAHAATTDKFLTPAMRAGVEWSGYSAGYIHDMVLNKSSVYAIDVDVDFYNTAIGLSDEYIWSNSRTATITVKDDDPGSNENEELFYRVATFGTIDGVYRPTSYGTRRIIDTEEIEDNNILELYLLITIRTVTGDQATAVDAGLFRYSFRTTY